MIPVQFVGQPLEQRVVIGSFQHQQRFEFPFASGGEHQVLRVKGNGKRIRIKREPADKPARAGEPQQHHTVGRRAQSHHAINRAALLGFGDAVMLAVRVKAFIHGLS